jgi:superfamily I DNA/RNA helicase
MISIAEWMPADGLGLEPNAMTAAVNVDRNLALTAGPGAGKTEMLAQRADFLLRTGVSRYPKRILAISFKVDASQNLKARVKKRCGLELAARFDSHTFHAFAKRLIDRFRVVLTGRDALDSDYTIGESRVHRRSITFQDMVPLAVQILQSSAIARNAVRQTYSHVFLDEFQDCTNIQYQLIHAAFHGTAVRLTAVGDTKQRIMGWAGALEGIFQIYANDFAALPLSLYQNFRSKPRLCRMQNAMIRVMDPQAAVPENDLAGEEGSITILRYEDDRLEAEGLAELMRAWIEQENLRPSDIAVLVSRQQNLYCQQLNAAMDARSIPYRNEDNVQDLASEPVVALIIDFLLVVVGSREPVAYRRIGDLIAFDTAADDEQEYRVRSRWGRFFDETRGHIASGHLVLSDQAALDAVVRAFLDIVGRSAVVSLSADYEASDRLDQLVIRGIEEVWLRLSQGGDPVASLAGVSGDNSVRIMSIHKSKGLEFDTVVVLGVETETFWGEEQAERSAYFVAISRAKRRLYLTVSARRERPDGARMWTTGRTGHQQFIGYAEPYL